MEDTGFIYLCSAGETFDTAALWIYGSEVYAPDLMAANPMLMGREMFSGGEKLNVPVVSEITDGANAPWK